VYALRYLDILAMPFLYFFPYLCLNSSSNDEAFY
jgi:hypothetical protein